MARPRDDGCDCDCDYADHAKTVKAESVHDRIDRVNDRLGEALRRLDELQEAVAALRERVG